MVRSSSASSCPSRAATASWSSRPRRSRPRPVTTCTASRTSSSTRCASSTAPWGRSASQAAAMARRMVMSRSPPWASLSSGSSDCARSPCRVCRWWRVSTSWGSRRRALARQSWATTVRAAATTSGSPATQVRSSRPTAALRSSAATLRHWLTVRTLWSSRTPASQTGYQMRSASSRSSSAASERPECSRTRSRSLSGPASPRAWLPTAASATPSWDRPPAAWSQMSTSHSRVREAMASLRTGPAPGASKPRAPARSRRSAARPLCSIVIVVRAPRYRARRCVPGRPPRPGRSRSCRHRSARSGRS